MNFFKRLFTTKEIPEQRQLDYFNPLYGSLQYNNYSSFKASNALKLSAVYRCVQVISDSVASLPLEPFKIDKKGYKRKYIEHVTYNLLSTEPNPNISRFTYFKTLVTHVLLKGNSYTEIIRDKTGNVLELNLLEPELVTVQLIDGSLKYKILGRDGFTDKSNIIHVLNYSYNGFLGISTIDYAYNSLTQASDADAHSGGFFRGGANMAGIIKTAPGSPALTKEQAEALKYSFRSAMSPETGTPNGLAILGAGQEYQPTQISPKDAMLLESRAFQIVEICRFFGVSPSKAFDLTKATYSNVESNQLAFLTDTLQPLLEKIELEFLRKLYKPSERVTIELKFDVSRILRADLVSQSDYYTKMFNLGVYTPNEIRKEINKEQVKGGDRAFIQVNVQPLDNLISENTTEPPNQIDNNLQQ